MKASANAFSPIDQQSQVPGHLVAYYEDILEMLQVLNCRSAHADFFDAAHPFTIQSSHYYSKNLAVAFAHFQMLHAGGCVVS